MLTCDRLACDTKGGGVEGRMDSNTLNHIIVKVEQCTPLLSNCTKMYLINTPKPILLNQRLLLHNM